MFKTLLESPVDDEVGVGILKQIRQRKQALALSEAAFKFSNGSTDYSNLVDTYKKLEEAPKEVQEHLPSSMDLEEILSGSVGKPGLRWRLNCLNKSLGSLRDGDFGFIFKRPESGGTAFCASEVGHMLHQAERPIIWINNEEQDDKVKLRIYQSYFGITNEQLRANRPKYREAFLEQVNGKMMFFGIDFSSRKTIEELVDKYNPCLVVYDQLDKVQGFEADRNDLKLGAAYQWARELTKRGHAAIGVTQADGSADGQKWLTMANVAEAKTTKQAEADWILGMGKTYDESAEYIRYLNICKNKLLGDEDTRPELRHGRFEVWIEPSIMQFKDIVTYD